MGVNIEDRTSRALPDATTAGADETAVRELYRCLLAGWSSGDGYAYAAQFTEDAEYIAFDGSRTTGRQAIASSHQQLFDSWLKGTRLTGQVTGLRFLNPEAALMHATGGTPMPGQAAVRPGRHSIQTVVATKQDGAWRFTAFHNTRVQRRDLLQNLLFGVATRVFRR